MPTPPRCASLCSGRCASASDDLQRLSCPRRCGEPYGPLADAADAERLAVGPPDPPGASSPP
eukprot:298578-Chlamydomonas_euryale.AAC.1